MTETDLLDISFMFLYSRQSESITYRSLEPILSNNGTHAIRNLDCICSISFASKEINRQATMGANTNIYNYLINSNGIHFIENLPNEFKDKPYSYFIKLENEKEGIERQERLDERKIKWPQKNWHWVALGTFILGLVGDVGKEVFHSMYIQKPKQDTTQLKQPVQVIHDTIYIQNNYNLGDTSKRIHTPTLKQNRVTNKKR